MSSYENITDQELLNRVWNEIGARVLRVACAEAGIQVDGITQIKPIDSVRVGLALVQAGSALFVEGRRMVSDAVKDTPAAQAAMEHCTLMAAIGGSRCVSSGLMSEK